MITAPGSERDLRQAPIKGHHVVDMGMGGDSAQTPVQVVVHAAHLDTVRKKAPELRGVFRALGSAGQVSMADIDGLQSDLAEPSRSSVRTSLGEPAIQWVAS